MLKIVATLKNLFTGPNVFNDQVSQNSFCEVTDDLLLAGFVVFLISSLQFCCHLYGCP